MNYQLKTNPANQRDDIIDSFIKKHCSFSQQLHSILEEYYHDCDLSVNTLAKKKNLSERHFCRLINTLLGLTPSQLLRNFRLEKSKRLLLSGKSVCFVAYEVGFSSHSYFAKCFKDLYGCSPSQYLQVYLQAPC